MKRIGLISDTHGYWDPKFEKYLSGCDEIWHAGDIGSLEIAEQFEALKPFRAVFGNIDDTDIRKKYTEINRFKCEDVDVLIKHIGGYPGKYDYSIKDSIKNNPPKLFISGHSHILKIMFDKSLNMLHINPGAAGNSGFHTIRTLVRFTIDDKDIKDVEVIELGNKQ